MTRKQFIEKFHLKKIGKIHVRCGLESYDRILYTDGTHNFVFVNNDLHAVNISEKTGIGHLGAGYNWYH